MRPWQISARSSKESSAFSDIYLYQRSRDVLRKRSQPENFVRTEKPVPRIQSTVVYPIVQGKSMSYTL